jgi:hypothetical protein
MIAHLHQHQKNPIVQLIVKLKKTIRRKKIRRKKMIKKAKKTTRKKLTTRVMMKMIKLLKKSF